MVREGRVLISVATDPDFGANYLVTACKIGAQVATGSSGNTVTVRAGHGFAAADKFIVGTSTAQFKVILSVTSTVLTLSVGTTVTVAAGDLLVNLGADTGASLPNYDGSGAVIYTDMDYSNVATNSTVQTDANGKYRYYHKGIARWELIRSSLTGPIALYTDTDAAAAALLNVKDFGAMGDGVTDDTVAIQAALTAVPSTGGKVYVPAGVYIVSAACWIKSNTHVYGDGIDVTIIKRKANSLSATVNPNYDYNKILTTGSAVGAPYTNASSGTSITVTDMTLDGNYTNQSLTSISNGADGFGMSHTIGSDSGGCVDGITLQRIKVQNVMQDGISLHNCKNVLVDSCVTYKTGQTTAITSKNGISLGGGPTDLSNGWCKTAIVTNNRISYSGANSGSSPAAEGIVNSIWDDVVISGNDISHVEYGIEITNTTPTYTNYGLVISNNIIHDLTDTGYAGIGITLGRSASYLTKGMVISGNVIHNTNFNGMVLGFVNGSSVTGNTLYKTNLVSDGTYFCGIDITNSTEVACSGNSIQFVGAANAVYGIRFLLVTGSLIANNTIINDNGSATGDNIILNGGVVNCLVTGNRLIGNKYGIQIHNSGTNSGNTAVSNYITGALTASYLDGSGAVNYLNYLDIGTVAATTTVTSPTVVASTTDFNSALTAKSTTALSANSSDIALIDNQATPQQFVLRKLGTSFYIVNNAGAAVMSFSADGAMNFKEQSSTPVQPTNQIQANMYMKGDKLIIEFRDGSSAGHWFSLDLTATTNQSWVYAAAAP